MSIEQEYCIFIFIGVLGVVQLSASYGNIRYILIFDSKILSSFWGSIIIFMSFLWFFKDGGRHIPDTEGGIAGFQQFMLFILCTFLSILCTYMITSVFRHCKSKPDQHYLGISSMRETTFWNILFNNIGIIWKRYTK